MSTIRIKKKLSFFGIKLFVVIFFWLITFLILISCKCVTLPGFISDKEYEGIDVIAKGKVVYTKPNEANDSSFVVLKIFENYTPEYDRTVLKLDVSTEDEKCGVAFEEGEMWLVFAYKKDSTYTTSSCSRTQKFIPEGDYKSFNDRYIDTYHKNLLYLKSKMR